MNNFNGNLRQTVVVDNVTIKQGNFKNGAPWTKYELVATNGLKASAFKPAVGQFLQSRIGQAITVQLEPTPDGKFLDLVDAVEAEGPPSMANHTPQQVYPQNRPSRAPAYGNTVTAPITGTFSPRNAGDDKEGRIVREVAIKAAVGLFRNAETVPDLTEVINIAKRFEAYIEGRPHKDDVQPSLVAAHPEKKQKQRVFEVTTGGEPLDEYQTDRVNEISEWANENEWSRIELWMRKRGYAGKIDFVNRGVEDFKDFQETFDTLAPIETD